MLDYEIRINDLIQVWLSREDATPGKVATSIHSADSGHGSAESEEECEAIELTNDLVEISQDDYYKIGDHVDALNSEYGAWFEGQIVNIFRSKASNVHQYDIKFWRSSLPDLERVTIKDIRPPMNEEIRFVDLKINETVLVNYNLNDPFDLPGYWFDFQAESIDFKRKSAIGTFYIGEIALKDQTIRKNNQIYKIRHNLPRNHRSAELNEIITQGTTTKRKSSFHSQQYTLDQSFVRVSVVSSSLYRRDSEIRLEYSLYSTTHSIIRRFS